MTADGQSNGLPAGGTARWVARPPLHHPRLVAHDIRFVPTRSAPRPIPVVSCERQGRVLPLDVCKSCPRFVRIDVHEAGYIMLCRSADEAP